MISLNRVHRILIWFGLVLLIACLLGLRNLPTYYRLATEGIAIEATVEAKEPENHQFVQYSYQTGTETFHQKGTTGSGNPSFEEITIGEKVLVFYLPKEPVISCLGNPKERFKSELMIVILASLGGTSLILLLIYQIKKNRPQITQI